MGARVLLVGLDGLEPAVADRMVNARRLPVLARLMAEGCAGRLQSTFPANSAPAWTSCRTGVNPGKHGAFGFWRRSGYEWPLVSSADIGAATLEQILSRRGRRVCSLNVPLTFPPRPVNGVMVTGLPTPGMRSDFTFPAAVADHLRTRIPDYQADGFGDLDTLDAGHLSAQLARRHAARRDAALWLLGQERWDLFMVVFTLADKVQHMLWGETEARETEGAPGGEPGAAVEAAYETLDATLGRLLEATGSETTVIVMSDHGFGPCRHLFHVNVWLREHGFLRLHRGHKLRVRRLRRPARGWRPRVELGPPRLRVDWRRTRAFGGLYVECPGLWLNIKGREPDGVITTGTEQRDLSVRLADDLLACRDDEGSPLLRAVVPRDDIYAGLHAAGAPDMLLMPHDEGIRLMGQFTIRSSLEATANSVENRGSHRPVGVLYARGPGCGALREACVSIMDVAPTVLHALDEAVPRYMDGRSMFAE